MKNLIVFLILTLLIFSTINAQQTQAEKDSIFLRGIADHSMWKTYEANKTGEPTFRGETILSGEIGKFTEGGKLLGYEFFLKPGYLNMSLSDHDSDTTLVKIQKILENQFSGIDTDIFSYHIYQEKTDKYESVFILVLDAVPGEMPFNKSLIIINTIAEELHLDVNYEFDATVFPDE